MKLFKQRIKILVERSGTSSTCTALVAKQTKTAIYVLYGAFPRIRKDVRNGPYRSNPDTAKGSVSGNRSAGSDPMICFSE